MKVKQVIIIDDDKLSNMVSVMMLRRISESIPVTSYTNPVQALEALETLLPADSSTGSVLVLLDINMPEMTGWKFLEYFREFQADLKSAYRIFVLSSSVDEGDIKKANEDSLVEGFISKPLKIELIKNLFD